MHEEAKQGGFRNSITTIRFRQGLLNIGSTIYSRLLPVSNAKQRPDAPNISPSVDSNELAVVTLVSEEILEET